MSKIPNVFMPRASPTARGPVPPKLLPGELGKRCGFIPADATDRIVGLPVGIAAQLPCAWTGPSSLILELRDCLIPRDLRTIFNERVHPVISVAIPACVHKLLVTAVRQLITVHKVIAVV